MKLRNLMIVMLAASALTGCSTRKGGPADVEYDTYKSPYHIVGRGETIASIAKNYHVDKRELVRLNGMKPPYRIVVGQKLLVGARSAQRHDEFYSPAEDAPQQGDVQVNTLAPLPGTEETPENREELGAPQSIEQGEEVTSTVEEDTTTQPQQEDDASDKGYKAIGQAPKSSDFFSWPVRGKTVKGFSAGKGGNSGINISAPKGTPVKAANNGVVSRTEQIPGYGKVVLIKHDKGVITVYAHLDQFSVKRGDVVEAGQKIGTVGKTGNVKEPQLHFKINKGKTPVDPTTMLD